MRPRTLSGRLAIYTLLLAGSVVFAFPFVWLLVTSLKPVEQTMQMPPTWVPRAFFATLDGRRVEVTRDYVVKTKSALVRPSAGSEKGKRILVPVDAYDGTARRAKLLAFENGMQRERWYAVEIERIVEPGSWHVTESSDTKIRQHELAWDVVPESAIEGAVKPRWDNFPKALATLGGRSLEEVEGSIARRDGARAEDAGVSFVTFLGNTLVVCVLGVLGSVLSNALVAYGLAKVSWKGRGVLFAVTMATMMVPFPVLMVPLYGVFKSLGLVGTLFPLWLPTFFGNAFNIFLMRQFFKTIPDHLGEAARLDGCTEFGIFWRIVLPLSRPVLAVVALLHFLFAWNQFLEPLLYLTRKHTFTLALALQNYQSQNGGVQWHYLMAASAVLIAPILVLFFLAQKTFIRGIATTGIKG
jgi:multiple sugar transport system permease protein